MKKHKAGSVSRQARRQNHKRQRATERARRQRARRESLSLKAGRTSGEPKAPPKAGSYLVRMFWEHLRLGELQHQAGVKTPQQIQAAQDKRDRKRLKVDQRKPEGVARWLEHPAQPGPAPD